MDKLSIWCLLDSQVEMSSEQLVTLDWNPSRDKDGNVDLGVLSIWIIFKAMRMGRE